MILTIASYKGGVGKTTTAVHLAAYLSRLAPTALFDGDAIRSSTKWSQRGSGNGLPFKVFPVGHIGKRIGDYTHAVIDTEANPTPDDFVEAIEGCDLLVIPAEPEQTAQDGLEYTLQKLFETKKQDGFRVLMTKVLPPPRSVEADRLRAGLVEAGVPVFKSQIPFLAAFHKASTEGTYAAVVKDDRNAKRAWDAYAAVGEEIVAEGLTPARKDVANG